MRLSARTFTIAVAGLTGLAVYVLFSGGGDKEQAGQTGIPGFQTIGENRVLNIFRRNKIRLPRSKKPVATITRTVDVITDNPDLPG